MPTKLLKAFIPETEAIFSLVFPPPNSYNENSADASGVVDQHILQTVYDRLLTPAGDENVPSTLQELDGQISESHTFKVIDAFQMPRLIWSEERRLFELFEGGKSKPSILGQPISRSLYLRDRFHVVRQVVVRNEHFSPPTVAGGAGEDERDEFMKVKTPNFQNLIKTDRLTNHLLVTS